MRSKFASHTALAFVVFVVGGSFIWWVRDRPSFILYKAHESVGELGQAAAIAQYRKMLASPTITHDDELKYRLELGTLYLRALEEANALSRYVLNDPDKPMHPFVEDAKKEFDRVLKLDPENAQAHLHLGQIFWLRNLEAYAVEELEIGRKKDPTNPVALKYLSNVYLESGDAAKARDLAQQALALKPDFEDARLVLVNAYHDLGDTMSALVEYERLSPGFKEIPSVRAQHALLLANQNFWTDADAEITTALKDAPNSGQIKLIFGEMQLDRNQPDSALGAFLQAQDLMPRNIWPLVWKARALTVQHSCDEPDRIGDLLTHQWPRWPWGRLVRASYYLCKLDDARAGAELDEAVRLSPDFAEGYRIRAQLLLERGQFDALGQAIRPMLDQKVLESEAHVFLSLSLLEQGNLSMAEDMAETAIRLNQRNAEAFMALGEVRAASRDVEGAERAYSEARTLNPYDLEIEARYLKFKARTHRGDDAEREFRILLQRAPGCASAWLRFGEVQLMRSELSDAVVSFQNALSEKPYLFDANLDLSEAYLRQDNRKMADVSYQRAAALSPRHPRLLATRKAPVKA